MAGRRRGQFDWKSFLHDKDVEIARLSGIYVTNLQKAGADLLHGKAQIVDAHTVEVAQGQGRRPLHRPQDPDRHRRPPGEARLPGRELGITSDEAFHLPTCPSG
jgi:glutathione reductase (NADPH)